MRVPTFMSGRGNLVGLVHNAIEIATVVPKNRDSLAKTECSDITVCLPKDGYAANTAPPWLCLAKGITFTRPANIYHESNEVTMKRPRPTVRSFSSLLLTGAVLFQMTLLRSQAIPIAVVEFEGNGISQTEAIALTDRLRNELFRLGVFEVVERGMMETILTEQDFQLTGCTSNECLIEVGQLLGARQVVGGRISRVGAMFTVSARVVDVQTGKLLGVSDYDLRGGLEEILTDGMKQVAVMLSAYGVVIKEEAPAVSASAEEPSAEVDVSVGKVVETAPAKESEDKVDVSIEEDADTAPAEEPEVQVDLAMEEAAPSQQPAATMEEKATEQAQPGLPVSIVSQKPRRWQSRFMMWGGDNYKYVAWSNSYDLPSELNLWGTPFQPVVSGAALYRENWDRDVDEMLFYGMLEVHRKWSSSGGNLGASVYSGIGLCRYEGHYEDSLENGISFIYSIGAQGRTRHSVKILPDVVGDIRLVHTPGFGSSIIATAGVQGNFLHFAGFFASVLGFLLQII